MKRKLWVHHLIGAVFAFALSVSTTGCLISGFELSVDSITGIFIWCGIFSACSAILLRFKYGPFLLLLLSALLALIAWKLGELLEHVQTLLWIITTHYHNIYGWQVLGLEAAAELDLALILVGWWTAVSVSFCYCRRAHIFTALPAVILPLVLCLIVTHTVPDTLYLYLLILGVSLLLLTDWVRRNAPAQGAVLTLRIAVPVALALVLLFGLNPREGYVYRAVNLHQNILNWFQEHNSSGFTVRAPLDSAANQKLDLRSVGPKSDFSYSVMRVDSPVGGTLYLRGRDYDSYSGTGWEASTERKEEFTTGRNSSGELTITTYGTRSFLYVPYYPIEGITLQGGFVTNEENWSRYSYDLSLYPRNSSVDSVAGTDVVLDQVIGPDDHQYLNLDSSRSWAKPLAASITSGCIHLEDKVNAIGDYVRDSASYDLDTPRMSDDYEDFAQWFLEESDTGYCVHFATAATVLLRAAGINARYVEGYMVTCTAGESTVVSNKSAHAWTEYYDADSGTWRILEATPADEDVEVTPTSPPATDPTETEPTETEAESTVSGDDNDHTDAVPGGDHSTQVKKSIRIPGWLVALLLFPAAAIGQAEVRIARKRQLWNQGNPNEKAIARWKQSQQLCRRLYMRMPENVEYVAQKACFSQHTLTREELMQFELFRREAKDRLKTLPGYRRLLLRLIFAIE